MVINFINYLTYSDFHRKVIKFTKSLTDICNSNNESCEVDTIIKQLKDVIEKARDIQPSFRSKFLN